MVPRQVLLSTQQLVEAGDTEGLSWISPAHTMRAPERMAPKPRHLSLQL